MSYDKHKSIFLLNEISKGNEKAFEILFHDNYSDLCRFAFSLIHDEDDACSIVQGVFADLWENRKSLSNINNIIPYLYETVRNKSINHRKRQSRKVELTENLQDSLTDETTEAQINMLNFNEHLLTAINQLPDRCKTAFSLSRFNNLTNKEIAKEMNISVKAVEALITRSLRLLRIALSEFLKK